MQLKTTTDYAIRVLVCLAAQKGKIVPSGVIAESMGIPRKYLTHIGMVLKSDDFIESYPGAYWGYRLLKDAEEIRLLDVVSLLEGTVRLNRCLENDCYCSRGAAPDCPVRKCYEVMQQKWESFLRGITIADILAGIEKEEVEKRIDGAAHQK